MTWIELHFRRGPRLLEQAHDPQHLAAREGGHVLAEVDGEIGLAVELVRSKRRAGNLGQDVPAQRLEPHPVGPPRRLVVAKAADQPLGLGVVAEPEGAVLAHHPVDRPHPGDVVAPAGRPAGDRHDLPAGLPKPLHGCIGDGRQPAVERERVVDVGEHHLDAAPLRQRPVGERRQTRIAHADFFFFPFPVTPSSSLAAPDLGLGP